MQKVTMDLTLEQADAVKMGLELLYRLGIGDLEHILRLVNSNVISSQGNGTALDPETLDQVSEHLASITKKLNLQWRGVGNELVSGHCKRAYEVNKVLSQALALNIGLNNPVEREGLLFRLTSDPLPEIKICD